MVKKKYQNVLDLGEKLKIQNGEVREEDGKLKVWGTANTQYHKDLLWDEIKRSGGEDPSDIMADIKVADTTAYAYHTVQKGESLSKIAKQYYGDPMMYQRIFEANRTTFDNPDMIHPGQELVIPNK